MPRVIVLPPTASTNMRRVDLHPRVRYVLHLVAVTNLLSRLLFHWPANGLVKLGYVYARFGNWLLRAPDALMSAAVHRRHPDLRGKRWFLMGDHIEVRDEAPEAERPAWVDSILAQMAAEDEAASKAALSEAQATVGRARKLH